jgi:hypothetical protein
MKNYILLIGVLVCLGAVSCEEYENSATPSEITYLPLIELEGEEKIELNCNASGFTDPGANAFEQGEPINVETNVVGTYFKSENINMPDRYQIRYSAVNEDGIPGLKVREVIWPACNSKDMSEGLEGMYTASVFRTHTSGATVDYSNEEFGPFYVVDLGDGKYGFSDVIGGFYEHGYGYGPAYAGTGFVIQANNIATNNFEVVQTNGVGAFGGEITVTDFKVDPIAETISWTAVWSFGYEFDVVLEQI